MREFSQYCSEDFKQYFHDFSFSKNANTRNEYISYINILCGFLEKDFLEITPADAQRFHSYMDNKRNDGNLHRKTINVRLACYNQVAMYIADRRDGYRNPFSRLIRLSVKNDFDPNNVPTFEELDRLFTEARKDPKDFLILSLATRCALSASDILRLETSSIIVNGDKVQLHIKSSSDFDGEMFILLPDDVKDILKDYLSKMCISLDSKVPLFTNKWKNPMTIQNVDQLIKRLTTKCNLERYTLKDFRARAIADMVSSGASMDEISEYTGLKFQRLEMFYRNLTSDSCVVEKICPPNLVNFRLVTN